ncbi:MAG: alpha/beta hydrolase [Fibromonadaceae bacterium]|nr:alpha/beta hydrolase [Fibromonadaceae bacterium]
MLLTAEIAWVSGWASDISIWEDCIYERFPNFSHRFVDYYDLIDGDLKLPESEFIIGWSMGTLALLKKLPEKAKEQKWILVCPIADFCAEGCWQPSALRATKRGILENTEQTLMSFSALMGNVPNEEREKWVENAMRYSPKQLAIGLDYLLEARFIAPLNSNTIDSNIKFIFGEKDKIVPLAQKELFSSVANEQITVYENLGHWLPDYFNRLSVLKTH